MNADIEHIAAFGQLVVSPDYRDAVIARLIAAQDEARNEPGCLSYTVMADLSDPNVIHIVEQWQSLEHVRAHIANFHSKSLVAWLQSHGLQTFAIRHSRATPTII